MILGIDQGTSGTSVLAFDQGFHAVARAYRPVHSHHPRPGWVEQDPQEIIQTVVEAVAEVLSKVGGAKVIQAAGLTNQGESVLAWDKLTGQPLTPVIVWSDRRAASIAEELRQKGHAGRVRQLTGLELSDYFCASKYAWLLRNDWGVQKAAKEGRLCLGTLDTWLALGLSGQPWSDQSTASRTQLVYLHSGEWDQELLEIFAIPPEALPTVRPSLGQWGSLAHPEWRGELPWFASLVDQPAALAGNGCFRPGELKITYGTGCFALVNAGDSVPGAGEALLASIAWSDPQHKTYALDGGVFTAATAVNWLVELGLANNPEHTSELAQASSEKSVRFLPAFTGLGAPWWDAKARGVFAGLTAGTTRADLVRAVLDSLASRVRDIVEAMQAAGIPRPQVLRVDGGLSNSRYLMQRQADLLGIPIERSGQSEATAFGAAILAASAAGLVDLDRVPFSVQQRFEPQLAESAREEEYAAWLAWLEAARKLPT